MARILGRIIVEKVNAREWKLHNKLVYHVGSKDSEETITVPKGFVTDFASVPRAFWWLFPPDGKWTGGAIIHDWLYYNRGAVEVIYSRKECDGIFLEAMAVLSVPRWKRVTMHGAVRSFGWIPWSKPRVKQADLKSR